MQAMRWLIHGRQTDPHSDLPRYDMGTGGNLDSRAMAAATSLSSSALAPWLVEGESSSHRRFKVLRSLRLLSSSSQGFCRVLPRTHRVPLRKCSALSGNAGEFSGSPPVFPRLNIRDPFKRLGISNEASEEEIREARNYLLKQYGQHPKSKASIESAYDKAIAESFKRWRNYKPRKLKERPKWLQKLYERFDTPPTVVIAARAFAFFLLGIWSVFGSGSDGPVLQVILSLAACIYFLKKRFKLLWKASAIGVASFLVAWVLGSFIVPALPTFIFPGSWNIELMTSLISYAVLWASCTFLK